MKIVIFLLFIFVFVSCGKYKAQENISLKDSEVRLTLFHTTDIHSKILPFQFTPNSWDRKQGLAPQDPQAHCNCDDGYYPEGKDCKPITTSDSCDIDSDCTGNLRKHCNDKNNRCYECLDNSHCNSNSQCVNYQCINKGTEAFTCEDTPSMCGSHGKCYDDNGSQFYGGMARLAYLLEKEKDNSSRWVYLDTGDLYQGAPIFNFFQGEPELRAMSLLKVDLQTLGNHEFDQGINNWMQQVRDWTAYPLLAANYIFYSQPNALANNQMPSIVMPYTIIRRNGLDIAFIGLANTASMLSIFDSGNSMQISPESMAESAQYYIDLLKNQVDLVVIASHGGLDVDQRLCKELSDVDVILGGHHHVVTDPPQVIISEKTGGNCVMVHSGVNLKFLGVLNLVLKNVKDGEGFSGLEVVSTSLREIPIDNTIDARIAKSMDNIKKYNEGFQIPENIIASDKKAVTMYNKMTELLANYEDAMYQILNVDESIGTAEDLINRIELNGGSSPLGNLVGDAMRTREFVDADFAVTNSLGIRADLPMGSIKISKIFEIFPFNNSITTMTLSGREVQAMFDYVADHSAERGCATQVQVSGIEMTLDCKNRVAKDIKIGKNKEPLNPYAFYEVATNDYMAAGGSGFSMLARVTTKVDTGIEIRNVVIDYIRKKHKIVLSDFEDPNRIRPMK
jgi:5'-nucleotidase